ncbi:hypothetical protein [Arthrobacter sp. NPDC093139]|uniref:hypothetical protein n=1 Tax=Arthrobacter sp. NPDC093139 TaxID=3363945 RepID=UPI00381EBCBE
MAGEALRPAPRGRWEKILPRSLGLLVFLATSTSSLLRENFGFWEATTMSFGAFGLGAFLLARLAAPQRKERLAHDAERGIIECAIRYPDSHPGSIRRLWLPGFAEVSRGTVRFQPDLVGEGDPAGTIRPFFDVIFKGPVEPPAKRPAEVKRGWSIVALETDEGVLHLAAGDAALKLLEERLGGPQSA